jgi:outer membrane lipoprotein-sorting protein
MIPGALLYTLFLQLAAVPAGEAILKRVETAVASVQDYTVSLDITANLEQATIPPMQATLYFKKPDRVHMESQGFAMLPREAFSLSPTRLLEHFRVESVRAESVEGRSVYRLRLTARDERARFHDAWLDVLPERWTIEGGTLSFADDRVLTVRFTYKQLGEVWLPSELFLSFSQSGASAPESSPLEDQKPVQIGRGAFRKGEVIIRYSGYRLNTGLSDDIFAPSSTPGER